MEPENILIQLFFLAIGTFSTLFGLGCLWLGFGMPGYH